MTMTIIDALNNSMRKYGHFREKDHGEFRGINSPKVLPLKRGRARATLGSAGSQVPCKCISMVGEEQSGEQ